jgi:zinc protease
MNATLRFFILLLSLMPCVGQVQAFDIQKVTSKAGISAWLVQSDHAPIVTLKFSILGGAGLDLVGKEGSSVLMADMLTEGAGTLDSEAFKLSLAQMSSEISFDASSDYLSGVAYCLKENCPKTFDLLRLALLQPRFDEKDYQRVKQQRLQALQQAENNQDAIGYEAWSALAFPGHHYGKPTAGMTNTLATLKISDVKQAHTRQLTRRNLNVSVVGDIDAATLSAQLDQMFGALPDVDVGPLPKIVQVAAGPITKVIPYEAPQTVVSFGGPGLREEGPDRVAAYVLGELLGGGAGFARLNQSLREKSGLTYGVSLAHAPSQYAAYMLGAFSTSNATAKQALALLELELGRMIAEGPSEDELRRVKSYINGSFALRLANSESIADMLLVSKRDGRDVDFIERRKARIAAVTVADVKRVAGLLLAPEKRVIVIVGKPDGL